MRKCILPLVALAAIASPIALTAAPASANAGSTGCVTRTEFRDVQRGMRAASSRSMATTMPWSLSICLIASCSCASRTLRSVTTMTESKTFSFSTWILARR